MSDQGEAPAAKRAPTGIRLSILVPPDPHFRPVVETALRIYLRPICRSAAQAPRLLGELTAMIDEVVAGEPLEVVFTCRQPSLEVTVRSGRRCRSRRWLLAPESQAPASL